MNMVRDWGAKTGTAAFVFYGGRVVLGYDEGRPVGIVKNLFGTGFEKRVLLEQAFKWVEGEGLDGLLMVFPSGAAVASAKAELGINIEPEAAVCRLTRRSQNESIAMRSASQHAVQEAAGQGADESLEGQDDDTDGGGGGTAEPGGERVVDTKSKGQRRNASPKRGRSIERAVDIGEGVD